MRYKDTRLDIFCEFAGAPQLSRFPTFTVDLNLLYQRSIEMSSVYQPKRKEMAKVKVVSSQHYKENRKKLRLIGSVSREFTNFVTTQRNTKTRRCSFIDDTSSLTKRSKNELVGFFMDDKNDRKHVAYLVVPKEKKIKK